MVHEDAIHHCHSIVTGLHDYQTLDSMVTLNQFQHSNIFIDMVASYYTINCKCHHNRARNCTVAIDINIIRGAYKTTYS